MIGTALKVLLTDQQKGKLVDLGVLSIGADGKYQGGSMPVIRIEQDNFNAKPDVGEADGYGFTFTNDPQERLWVYWKGSVASVNRGR